MRKLIIFILWLMLPFTAGCSDGRPASQYPAFRVVNEITILSNNSAGSHLSRYSDPKEMSKILNYIRCLDPWDRADTTDSAETFGYTITLYLSDGSKKQYEQHGLTYFRLPGDTWRRIPADRGIRLPLIVEAIK